MQRSVSVKAKKARAMPGAAIEPSLSSSSRSTSKTVSTEEDDFDEFSTRPVFPPAAGSSSMVAEHPLDETDRHFDIEEIKHQAAATSATLASRPRESTLLSEIASFQLPDNVRIQAQEVARRLKLPIRRGKKRRQLLFYCLYSAYAELNIVQDPVTIALMVGIERSQIGRALSLFSEAQTGYAPPMHIASAVDFVPRYAEQMGLQAHIIGDLVSIAQAVIERDSELAESYPQKVAAAIVSYYLSLNNLFSVSSSNLTLLSGFSEPTIKSVVKRVAAVHNSIIADLADANSTSGSGGSSSRGTAGPVSTPSFLSSSGTAAVAEAVPSSTPAFMLFSSQFLGVQSGVGDDVDLDD